MYRALALDRFFLEIEEGPVVLIATRHRGVDNVMCLSWLMPLGFSRTDCDIAVMTGPWNRSFEAIMGSRVCTINVPTESLMEQAIRAGSMSVTAGDKFAKIGLQKREYLACSRSPDEIALMGRLKALLDPNNILNPGKVLEPAGAAGARPELAAAGTGLLG